MSPRADPPDRLGDRLANRLSNRLSPVEAERQLQYWVLAVIGWLLVSLAVVAITLAASGRLASGTETASVGHQPLRLALGSVHLLACLVLPALAARRRASVPQVTGLLSQYRYAAFVLGVFSVPSSLFYSVLGFAGAAVLAVTWLGLLTLREDQANGSHDRAEHGEQTVWASVPDLAGASRSAGRDIAVAVLGGAVLAVLVVVVLLVFAT